ncbi:hypothetical protein [Streptomyces noursei]|uniref:hypothetical protein n=1 Tax=Streptomyces noursei TaxID=1971 RepID=UPI0030F0EDFF
MREMLRYLGAALPASTSAAARLLALQCALRMNTQEQVRLPAGVLRRLRLADRSASWRELEHAQWLRTASTVANAVVAELLDTTLLSQAPACPGRLQAADWAQRVTHSPTNRPVLLVLDVCSFRGGNDGSTCAREQPSPTFPALTQHSTTHAHRRG